MRTTAFSFCFPSPKTQKVINDKSHSVKKQIRAKLRAAAAAAAAM